MDYSLLLGIHYKSPAEEEEGGEGGGGGSPARMHVRRLGGGGGSTTGGGDGGPASVSGGSFPITPPAPSAASGGGILGRSADGSPSPEIYYLGIIDILQQYDLRKMGETAVKALYQPVAGISAVGPARYADRFVKFIADHTE